MPPQLEGARTQIAAVIRRADTKPPLRDASRDVTVRLKKEVTASPEFLTLWDQIKRKTVYRVQIDESELIRRSVAGLKAMAPIPKTRIVTQTADIHIEAAGITHTERGLRTTEVSESYSHLPNILMIIGEQTLTKRATVYEILKQSERLQDFLNDPQMFIEYAVQIIRDVRRALAVDGISYKKLYGEEYFWQEIFDSKELIANLDRNAVAVDNSIYDYIIYDNTVFLQQPSLFDDPYDCTILMGEQEFAHYRIAYYARFPIRREDENVFELQHEIFALSLQVGLYDFQQSENAWGQALYKAIHQEYVEFQKKTVGKFRVACFTESPYFMLMWAHYANNHQGFCIEYEVPSYVEPYIQIFHNIMPVIYSNERVSVIEQCVRSLQPPGLTADILWDIYKYGLLMKSIDWKYQNEWRLISCDNLLSSDSDYNCKFFQVDWKVRARWIEK